MRRVLLAAAGFAALSACATQNEAPYYPLYSNSIATYAAADRDLLVEVYGNPTGAPKPAFDQRVVAAMQGKTPIPNVNFVAGPSPSERPPYRVVMQFNAPPVASAYDLCAFGEPPSAPGDRPIRVVAAFCTGPRLISRAQGTLADPAVLETSIAQLTLDLMPRESPDERLMSGKMGRH